MLEECREWQQAQIRYLCCKLTKEFQFQAKSGRMSGSSLSLDWDTDCCLISYSHQLLHKQGNWVEAETRFSGCDLQLFKGFRKRSQVETIKICLINLFPGNGTGRLDVGEISHIFGGKYKNKNPRFLFRPKKNLDRICFHRFSSFLDKLLASNGKKENIIIEEKNVSAFSLVWLFLNIFLLSS